MERLDLSRLRRAARVPAFREPMETAASSPKMPTTITSMRERTETFTRKIRTATGVNGTTEVGPLSTLRPVRRKQNSRRKIPRLPRSLRIRSRLLLLVRWPQVMARSQTNAVSVPRGKHLQRPQLPHPARRFLALRAPAPWGSSTMMQERAIAAISLSSLVIAEQAQDAARVVAVAGRVVNYPGLKSVFYFCAEIIVAPRIGYPSGPPQKSVPTRAPIPIACQPSPLLFAMTRSIFPEFGLHEISRCARKSSCAPLSLCCPARSPASAKLRVLAASAVQPTPLLRCGPDEQRLLRLDATQPSLLTRHPARS